MKWVVALLMLILACGCTQSDVVDIPPEELPPATGDPGIPIITIFEECAKYYPVMESYPRQCRDAVSGKTFTEIICSEGEIQTAECPDGTLYYAQNCVDGRWVTIKYLRNPCEELVPLPDGTVDPNLEVDIYDAERAYKGLTIFPDNHDEERPRVAEVNMKGELVWEYVLPEDMKDYTNPGFDVDPLANGNILLVLPGLGIFEIDREKNLVWSHLDPKCSHDADRLENGNTLYGFGNNDLPGDAQVKEVDTAGNLVWQWKAADHFPDLTDIYDGGFTHTNAVSRMTNGNTLISPRNFNFLVEVDPQGQVVRTIGEDLLRKQHDPEVQPDGSILLADHGRPQSAMLVDPQDSELIWQKIDNDHDNWPLRDANRLPNGNILITGTTNIYEVTQAGEIVWRLNLKGVTLTKENVRDRGFFKAERIRP